MRPMDVKELSTTTCKKYFKNKGQGRRKHVSRRPVVFLLTSILIFRYFFTQILTIFARKIKTRRNEI